CIGVDPPHMDLVTLAPVEIEDDVGRGRSGAHFAVVEEERIGPVAAEQRVLVGPADDLVVAVGPADRVASGTALEPVVPAAAMQRVVAVVAVELVGPGKAIKRVLASRAAD